MRTIEELTRAAEIRGQASRYDDTVKDLTIQIEGVKAARHKAILEGRQEDAAILSQCVKDLSDQIDLNRAAAQTLAYMGESTRW